MSVLVAALLGGALVALGAVALVGWEHEVSRWGEKRRYRDGPPPDS